ncbi:MAG: hypothetical protein ACREB1_08910 [Sphingomicrobium sp.]
MRKHPSPSGLNRRLGVYALLASVALATPQALQPANIEFPFNPANFSAPLFIDNPLFPLVAGRTFTYRGSGPDGCEEIRTAVTHQTKTIAGIKARVVRDQAYEGSCGAPLTLVEDTFDWFAQDNAGNVWYMGEDTRDCEGAGNCVPGHGSWQAGVNGAKAGLIMLANPHMGDHYRQEYYVGFAEDEATVAGVGLTVRLSRPDAIQPRQFNNCLKTREYTRLEPGVTTYKYYCPNVGLVMEQEKDIQIELVAIR